MQGRPAVVRLAPDFEHSQLSAALYSAAQRTISDQLGVAKPELAGTGNGFDLWRLLIREREVPEQPL
eukprot:2193865-Alexandrium_andersonii.AAC.1